MAVVFEPVAHFCYIAQVDQPAFGRGGYDDVAQVVERFQAACRLDIILAGADVDAAAGDVDVVGLDGAEHLVEAQAVRGHFLQVDLDLDLALGVRAELATLECLHLFQAALQFVGAVFHGRVAGAFGGDGNLHDRYVRRGGALHFQHGQRIGQLGAQLVDLADDVVVLGVDIHAVGELHAHDHQPVVAVGDDLFDVVELIQHILDRLGHELFHIGRPRAGVNGQNNENGRIEGRVFPARHGEQGAPAQQQHHDEYDDGELVVLHREFRDLHEMEYWNNGILE